MPSRLRDRFSLQYGCDEARLSPDLRRRFVPLDLGDEGEAYLDHALSSRPGRAKTTLHRVLREWMSDFDADGRLDMYPMHLLGTSQWRALLGQDATRRHLDVGAGSGYVTATLAPLAGETVTTETSRVMAQNLRRRGFRCHEADVAVTGAPEPKYDLVSCLNVIDRCARPRSLLSRVTDALVTNGRLVLATPLPLDPFVFEGPRSVDPEERLDVSGKTWEKAAIELVENVLLPLGLEVEALSRVPYLCRGDAQRELYVLDDALFVCRKSGD